MDKEKLVSYVVQGRTQLDDPCTATNPPATYYAMVICGGKGEPIYLMSLGRLGKENLEQLGYRVRVAPAGIYKCQVGKEKMVLSAGEPVYPASHFATPYSNPIAAKLAFPQGNIIRRSPGGGWACMGSDEYESLVKDVMWPPAPFWSAVVDIEDPQALAEWDRKICTDRQAIDLPVFGWFQDPMDYTPPKYPLYRDGI